MLKVLKEKFKTKLNPKNFSLIFFFNWHIVVSQLLAINYVIVSVECAFSVKQIIYSTQINPIQFIHMWGVLPEICGNGRMGLN